ncbi:hypothetical protein F4813DRAFT_386235 [Daldinia decipiens]|uniref:uncharacterized protein n=1 Tax=Daldinia decipiens TaxID=326647 RepID=UPI0020C3FC19|nr:uncharacterized protein F4813DRAFT_386235 [Daldinia decipiens]KAI1660824.1 hypothetical protein F4813DRAFT_386235 [Daldinia decipiens]
MCHHRKIIYQCNHTAIDPSPLKVCEVRRDHESGLTSGSCDVVETHGWSNFKVPRLCSLCHDKKTSLDNRLSRAKSLIADLKKQLTESYDQCVLHMDEAGLESEKKQEPSLVVPEKAATVESDSVDNDPEETMEKIDPVEEFLKKKKQESYAHLMMISDYK